MLTECIPHSRKIMTVAKTTVGWPRRVPSRADGEYNDTAVNHSLQAPLHHAASSTAADSFWGAFGDVPFYGVNEGVGKVIVFGDWK